MSHLGGSVSHAAIPEPAFHSWEVIWWPANRDGFSRQLSDTKCSWTLCVLLSRELCHLVASLLQEGLASYSSDL